MAFALGIVPLAYVSSSLHSYKLLKANYPTRPSRVLSREACQFASKRIPLYISLDPSQEDIRLLVVHPGQDSADIVCSLQEVSLLKHPKFTALSYHWKASTFQFHTSRWTFRSLLHYVCQQLNIDPPEIPILVDGKRFLITPNLDAALHHLRKPDSPLKIWVDAICIDQGNSKEKESQIPLMDKIYGQAEMTYLWLGPAAEDSDTAMDFIASSGSVNTVDEINALSPPYPALLSFFNRTWWSRIWVVQEALLSRNAIFKCGQKEVPMSTFAQVADKERAHRHKLREPIDNWDRAATTPSKAKALWIFMPPDMPFYPLLLQFHYGRNPVPQSFFKQRWKLPDNFNLVFTSKDRDILMALVSTRSFNSTLPRDKIYGLLAIVSPTSRAAIDVDYSGRKTDSDVFKELMVHVLKCDMRLLPLQYVEAGTKMLGFPSWAIDFSALDKDSSMLPAGELDSGSSYYASDTDLSWERLVHPTSGSVPTAKVKLNSAPLSTWERSTSCVSFSDNDNTLILRGILFDTISFTGSVGKLKLPNTTHGINSKESMEATLHAAYVVLPNVCRRWQQEIKSRLNNPYHTPQGRHEAFLRTLTTNRYVKVASATAFATPQAYEVMINSKVPHIPEVLLAEYAVRTTLQASNLMKSMDFNTMVIHTLANRAFIITERGYLGAAPKMAREGDAVCVFQGGHVPFVVRPKGEGCWEFVGHCYVQGIMSGEVVKEARREDVKMFRLV